LLAIENWELTKQLPRPNSFVKSQSQIICVKRHFAMKKSRPSGVNRSFSFSALRIDERLKSMQIVPPYPLGLIPLDFLDDDD